MGACEKPLEYFKEIDSDSWQPAEKALLRSLLNTYNTKKCSPYAPRVITIHERYQSLLQPEGNAE